MIIDGLRDLKEEITNKTEEEKKPKNQRNSGYC